MATELQVAELRRQLAEQITRTTELENELEVAKADLVKVAQSAEQYRLDAQMWQSRLKTVANERDAFKAERDDTTRALLEVADQRDDLNVKLSLMTGSRNALEASQDRIRKELGL